MTLKWPFSSKSHGNDSDIEMAAPVASTGMAGMQVALILDQKIVRRKRLSQD